MKPTGPVPSAFRGAPLVIAGQSARDWAERFDTPLFVYDVARVREKVAAFNAAFPNIDLHYAIKANPFPPLVAAVAGMVDGLDVASAGELTLALASKTAAAISFAGPGKRDRELEAAIRAGATINLESAGEGDRALAIGDRLGTAPRLAVRINPPLELRGSGMRMGGRPSPFGVDAEVAAPLIRRIVDADAEYRGIHIFAGSQALDPCAIIEAQAASVALAAQLAEETGTVPPLVNLGGGFGIPYFPGEMPLDLAAIGAALAETLAVRSAALADSRFAIELGRWLVGETGVYLTRVVDKKVSRGELFLVVDGGLHHQLAASGNFGTVVRRNYPVAIATASPEAVREIATVVGCLCTPLDRLADQVELPVAEPGDLVAIFMAGAYGRSASPTAFLGHPEPAEILADGDNPNAIFTSPTA